MKRMFISLVAVIAISLVGCDSDFLGKKKNGNDKNALMLLALASSSASSSSSTSSSSSSGTNVSLRSITVVDANGVNLGYAYDITHYYISIITSKGYTYFIDYTGKLVATFNYGLVGPYFANTDCTGAIYATALSFDGTISVYGKFIITSQGNSKIYIPKTINSDGTAYYSSTKITLNSYYSNSCVNSTYSNYGVELVETTRAAVGIPETITPPLSFVSQ